VPGPTTDVLAAAARAAGAHVVAGISQRHPHISELLYNTAVLIDPDGELVGVQHKVHACRDEKEYFVPGDRVDVFPTALGVIGLELCYDVRFPELARVQALAGAELIVSLWASAVQPGRVPTDSIIARCATRAMENALFFLGCNRTGTDHGQVFYGRSAIAGPDGGTLAASDSDREEAVRGTLEAEDLHAQRRYLTIFRDRRPELYTPLVERLSDSATGSAPHSTPVATST
jgi:predicted amidohydrolase